MKIFVSYRREDTQHVVGRLCEPLARAFGPANVFYDMNSVATGGDFLGTVGGAIYSSDVILVVIGHQWATISDSRGQRLKDRDDPVGWEVKLALASGKTLIPLLVDGAGMPTKRELPRALRDLTTRSGLRLDGGPGFDASVQDLIQRLGGPTAHSSVQPPGTRAPRRTAAWTSFEGNWQTPDGGMTRIIQDANVVELQGAGANGVTFQGRGQTRGPHAILEFTNSSGNEGRLMLELVENGAYINGQFQTFQGTVPFQMMRRG